MSTLMASSPKPDMQKAYEQAIRFAKDLHKNKKEYRDVESTPQPTNQKYCRANFKAPITCNTLSLPTISKKGEISNAVNSQNLHKLLVFISCSMPQESIAELLKHAHEHQAILVMQGLKDNSFKKTAEFFKEFGDLPNGIEINPELFSKYDIKAVPVFVLLKDDQEVTRLSGNVTLDFADLKLKENT